MGDNTRMDKSKFDWVAAREACTLPKVFKSLLAEVEGDVKERNAQRPENASYAFSFVEQGNTFAVVLEAETFRRSVVFAYEDHAILVLDASGNQMFEVTLNFSDDGNCRMKAKEDYRESWQIRRMALEDILFRIT